MPQKKTCTPQILGNNGIVLSEIKYTRAFSFICSKQLSIKKQTITHRDSIDEGGGVDLENNDQGSSSSIGLDLKPVKTIYIVSVSWFVHCMIFDPLIEWT